MFTAALGITATVLTILRGWPQAARIAVHKDLSGVSVWTWTLMLATHTTWIVYTIAVFLPVVLIANVLSALACAAVLLTIARHGTSSTLRPLWTCLAAGSLAAFTYLVGGPAFVSTGLTILTAVMLLPQVAVASTTPPFGVSSTTWWLAVASSIVWSTYYVLIGHPILVLPNAVILPCSLAILFFIYKARKTAHDPTTQSERVLVAD